jgi:hypothetical protein
MARRRQGGQREVREFADQLLARMARYPDAESLNDNVITPFSTALEKVCRERGYVLNIYGDSSNLVISSEEDAEAIFQLIEEYFEAKEAEDADPEE